MTTEKDLKAHLEKIDNARMLLEDLNGDLRTLWERDAFDFEDSIWAIEDACSKIEDALCLHDTPIENVA